MADTVCVVCSKRLTGQQTRFCSSKCNNTDYQHRRPARAHERYLRRKATGYYATVCACGGPKSRQSDHCLPCERKRIAPKGATCVSCGSPTKGQGKQCRSCAQLERFATPAETVYDNPYCPNPEGRTACGLMQPHNHCRYCSWPIPENEGMCKDCVRAVERGACMTPKDSRKYEEQAA